MNRKSVNITKWVLGIILILLLSYPHVELSRLIICHWAEYGLVKPFYLELLTIWVDWAICMFLVTVAIRRLKV